MSGRITAALLFTSSTLLAQPAPPPAKTTEQAAPPPPATAAPPATTAAPAPPPPSQPPPYGYPNPYAPPPYPYPYAPPPPPPAPPAVLPYSDGDPVPPGYHVESRVRRGPIIAGAIMAGSTYFVNILIAGVEERSNDSRATYLYIPGIGTWAYVDDACDNDNEDSGCQFVVLHSLTHSIGLGLVIYGIAAPKTVLARDTASVRITPLVGNSLSGLAATGTF